MFLVDRHTTIHCSVASITATATRLTVLPYSYEATDNTHYDKFDFRNDDGSIGHFDPNSDMAFGEFKDKMKEEWDQRSKAGQVAANNNLNGTA